MKFSDLSPTPLLLLALLGIVRPGYAQKKATPDLVLVSLYVIGEGKASYLVHDTTPAYFMIATVTNQQDTAIHFWVMTCSWPEENWVASTDSVLFGNYGCDSNFPILIDLLPRQSVHFYGALRRGRKAPFPPKVSLGFLYYNSGDFIWSIRDRKKDIPDIYWSNEVDLKDNLFQFQVDSANLIHYTHKDH